jgi:hypothetical protein
VSKTVLNLGTGKISTFGGPADMGVGPSEGLALVGPTDLGVWWYSSLFLAEQPAGTFGVARRLNPRAFYIAMRWDEVLKPHGYSYDQTGKAMLRHSYVRVSANGLVMFARPVDYGPGDGKVVDGQQDPDTGRLADLAPGLAMALGLVTDQSATFELILPEVES